MSGDRYTFCSSKLVLIFHTSCLHFGPYIFRKIFYLFIYLFIFVVTIFSKTNMGMYCNS
jgi:hypothetical protein